VNSDCPQHYALNASGKEAINLGSISASGTSATWQGTKAAFSLGADLLALIRVEPVMGHDLGHRQQRSLKRVGPYPAACCERFSHGAA
jgi:hypothetical protein